MNSLHCVVTGQVQGVCFRSWVFDQAQSLGLTGWVRNLDDGKVEILAQGDEASAEEFKKRLRRGSQLSRVEDVKGTWIDYEKTYSGFEIRG